MNFKRQLLEWVIAGLIIGVFWGLYHKTILKGGVMFLVVFGFFIVIVVIVFLLIKSLHRKKYVPLV